MVGRTNAGGCGMKVVTGTVSLSSYKQTGTDYTTDYAIIPASSIGFTPKIVLICRTDSNILGAYPISEKVLYGNNIFENAVYPDLDALYFSSTYTWTQSGTSTNVSYITISGTQYAYVANTSKYADVVWFHQDGSIRFTMGRYTGDTGISSLGYVILG